MADQDPFVKLIPAGEAVEAGTPMFWEAQSLPYQMVIELRRRSNQNNIGLYNTQDICTNFTPENYTKYRGPMTPWVRCFSNGTGQRNNPTIPVSKYLDREKKNKVYNGFLLQAGQGFYRGYGVTYNNNSLDKSDQILGYQADGTPHVLNLHESKKNNFYNISDDKYTPGMLPPPGITSVDISTVRDNMLSYVTINWKCYGLAQLEYMIPFFLTPGINLFVEFGWNLFNIKSLINYNNLDECLYIKQHPDSVTKRYYDSMGNYGCVTGIIHKYNIHQKDGIQFDCKTDIISAQSLYAGFKIDKNNKDSNSIGTWIKENLKKLKDVIKVSYDVADKKNKPLTMNAPKKYTAAAFGTGMVTQVSMTQEESIDEYNGIQNENSDSIEKEWKSLIVEEKRANSEIKELEKRNFEEEKNVRKQYYSNEFNNTEEYKKLTAKNNTSSNFSSVMFNVNNSNTITVARNYYISEHIKTDFEYQKIIFDEEKLESARKDKERIKKQKQELKDKMLRNTTNFIRYFNVLNNNDFSEVSFYNGEAEDRFFSKETLEYKRIDNIKVLNENEKRDKEHQETLDYEYIINNRSYIYSKVESSFKGSDDISLYGWVQLDFIFELINYLINNQPDYAGEKFQIDISDSIVTAHPNLISVDPSVIIPNAIAPKLNYPTPIAEYSDKKKRTDYLQFETNEDNPKSKISLFDMLTDANIDDKTGLGETQINDIDVIVNRNTFLNSQTETVIKFLKQYPTVYIPKDGVEKKLINRCMRKCKNVFLIKDEKARDDIATIVHRHYYEIGNHEKTYTSIPFLTDRTTNSYKYGIKSEETKLEDVDGNPLTGNTYKALNYGYIKYIYVSVNKLIQLYEKLEGSETGNTSLQDYIKSILKLINDSVCNYWNLDVIGTGDGKLTVIDRNTGYNKTNIYTFEIGTTNSAVKSFSFNINLSNEQSTQVLFSSGYNKNSDNTDTSDSTCQSIKEKDLPAFSYKDRINEVLRKKHENGRTDDKKEEENRDLSKLKRQNDAIQILQTSLNDPNTNIVALKNPSTEVEDYSYVCLNVSPDVKNYVRDILYTPLMLDEKDNKQDIDEDSGYTGPADNFIATLTFDGILGFRLMQHFAIDNLPEPFTKEKIIFQVNEVKHQITNSKWETVVTAMVRHADAKSYNYIII